ncbi:hypothetical protein GGS21DRAFT_151233 [Xylaria nigripes]|nr:hypothetical protein GGS21DRAFT_151233 [Xylaria nigripes]
MKAYQTWFCSQEISCSYTSLCNLTSLTRPSLHKISPQQQFHILTCQPLIDRYPICLHLCKSCALCHQSVSGIVKGIATCHSLVFFWLQVLIEYLPSLIRTFLVSVPRTFCIARQIVLQQAHIFTSFSAPHRVHLLFPSFFSLSTSPHLQIFVNYYIAISLKHSSLFTYALYFIFNFFCTLFEHRFSGTSVLTSLDRQTNLSPFNL